MAVIVQFDGTVKETGWWAGHIKNVHFGLTYLLSMLYG